MAEEEKKQSMINSDTEMIDTSSKPQGSPDLKKHKSKPLTEEEVKKSHCLHGPKGKCINCLGVTKDSIKDIKQTCKHGPNEKCVNCLGPTDLS